MKFILKMNIFLVSALLILSPISHENMSYKGFREDNLRIRSKIGTLFQYSPYKKASLSDKGASRGIAVIKSQNDFVISDDEGLCNLTGFSFLSLYKKDIILKSVLTNHLDFNCGDLFHLLI